MSRNFLYIKSDKKIRESEVNDIINDSRVSISWLSPNELLASTVDYEINNSSVISLLGRVALYNDRTDFEYLEHAMLENDWPLNEEVSGNYAGFYSCRNQNLVRVFTDALGAYPVYYHLVADTLIISSSLSQIAEIAKTELNFAGLYLEVTGHFSQYGRMTCWKGVQRLYPGECLTIKNFKCQNSKFDTSIKDSDAPPSENFKTELIDLIENENQKLYSDKKILITLSGGIDSRINLAPLLRNKSSQVHAINYGIEDGIDSSIPVKIAKDLNFPIEVIDPTSKLFPPISEIFELAVKTDSIYVNVWHGILLSNTHKSENYDYVLLGDMFDILRAKSISSLKSRKFRLQFHFKKFFLGHKLPMKKASSQNKQAYIEVKREKLISNIDRSPILKDFTKEQIVELKKDINADFNSFVSHLERYKTNYLESYEELFGLFTNGRLKMCKQLNLLRYRYNAEIPLSNIKIVRKVLNVAPQFRYADELTHKMFRDERWRYLSKYATSQNPFIPYSSPLPFVYAGWALRSNIDQKLIRRSIGKGKSEKRLFKTYSLAEAYRELHAADNFTSYFSGTTKFDYSNFIRIFKKRRSGESWPLSPMELIPAVQCSFYEHLNNKITSKKNLN
jgi:hypothetical protein